MKNVIAAVLKAAAALALTGCSRTSTTARNSDYYPLTNGSTWQLRELWRQLGQAQSYLAGPPAKDKSWHKLLGGSTPIPASFVTQKP